MDATSDFGRALAARFASEGAAEARAARKRTWVFASALLAPAAPLAAVLARVAGTSAWRAAVAALAAWVAAGALAALLALRAARRRPARGVARRLDESAAAAELFSAAEAALSGPTTRFAPLVLAVAARRAEGLPALPLPRVPRRLGPKAAAWLIAALLVAFAPVGPHGIFGGAAAGRGEAGVAEVEPRAASRGPDADGADDLRPDLRDLAQLRLSAGAKVVPEQEEIVLGFEFLLDRAVGADPPLELVLAVADGLPSPDQGFGEGFRVVRVAAGWRLPTEDGARLLHVEPVLATLKALGVYREGLFTFVAAARVADRTASVRGGVLSNELVIRVAPNVDRARAESPTATPKPEREKKAEPKPDRKDSEGPPARGAPPELGAPEELPDVSTYASLVRPLFNEGPTVEKDVAVYEREKGGDAPPPPGPRPPPPTPSAPIARRPEAAVPKAAFGPVEREVLRRYFERLGAAGP